MHPHSARQALVRGFPLAFVGGFFWVFFEGGGVTLPRTQTPCLSSSSRAVESKGKQAGLGTILQAFILGGRYSAKPSDAVVTRPATAPAFTGLPEQQDRGQIHSLAMPGGCALRPSHPESMAPGLCTDANSGQASRPPAPRCHPLYGSGPASPLTSPPQTPPPYLLSSSHTGPLVFLKHSKQLQPRRPLHLLFFLLRCLCPGSLVCLPPSCLLRGAFPDPDLNEPPPCPHSVPLCLLFSLTSPDML